MNRGQRHFGFDTNELFSMNLRTVTIWTTIVILIAFCALGIFYFLVLINDDADTSPTDVFLLPALAGIPLLVNLLFLRFSKNRVSDVILLIAAVLQSVPMFVILILIYDNDPRKIATIDSERYIIPIVCSCCILLPCWILAYGVDVFFRVTRQGTAEATSSRDKERVTKVRWRYSRPHSSAVNEQSPIDQNTLGIPATLSCPICGRTPELLLSTERISFRCEGSVTEGSQAEHQLSIPCFETMAEATIEWNKMVRRIRRRNPSLLLSYLQEIFRHASAAPRTATIRTTGVLLIALLALGLLVSLLQFSIAGLVPLLLSLFAGLPLIVNLSLLQIFKSRVAELFLLVAATFYGVPVIFYFTLNHSHDLTTAGSVYPLLFIVFPVFGAFLLTPCWLIAAGAEVFVRLTRPKTMDSPSSPDDFSVTN